MGPDHPVTGGLAIGQAVALANGKRSKPVVDIEGEVAVQVIVDGGHRAVRSTALVDPARGIHMLDDRWVGGPSTIEDFPVGLVAADALVEVQELVDGDDAGY